MGSFLGSFLIWALVPAMYLEHAIGPGRGLVSATGFAAGGVWIGSYLLANVSEILLVRRVATRLPKGERARTVPWAFAAGLNFIVQMGLLLLLLRSSWLRI